MVFSKEIFINVCNNSKVIMIDPNLSEKKIILTKTSYYKDFYGYYMIKNEYIEAANYIYNYILRIYKDINNETNVDEKVLDEIILSINLCINALQLCSNDIKEFISIKFDSVYDGKEDEDNINEYSLIKALVYAKMQKAMISHGKGLLRINPLKLYKLVLEEKEFELCKEYCDSYNYEMNELIVQITTEYLRDNNEKCIKSCWEFELINGCGVTMNKYYEELLRNYLETCNPNYHIILFELAVKTIFEQKNYKMVPSWLIDSFINNQHGNSLSALIRIYLKYNLLLQSLEFIIRWISKLLLNKENKLHYIPFDMIDYCIVLGNECLRINIYEGEAKDQLIDYLEQIRKLIEYYYLQEYNTNI